MARSSSSARPMSSAAARASGSRIWRTTRTHPENHGRRPPEARNLPARRPPRTPPHLESCPHLTKRPFDSDRPGDSRSPGPRPLPGPDGKGITSPSTPPADFCAPTRPARPGVRMLSPALFLVPTFVSRSLRKMAMRRESSSLCLSRPVAARAPSYRPCPPVPVPAGASTVSPARRA